MENQCKFTVAWVGKCSKPTVEGSDFCEKHININCSSCGEPATKECDETMGLVCGSPLCSECEHTTCENGCNSGAKLPEGVKMHCKPDQQVYKPWYQRKDKEDIYINK